MKLEVEDRNLLGTTHYYKAHKLFRNIEDYAEVKIILPDWVTLESIRARTIKPDGSIIELQQKDF